MFDRLRAQYPAEIIPYRWKKGKGSRLLMHCVPIGSVPLDYLQSLWLRTWWAAVLAWARGQS